MEHSDVSEALAAIETHRAAALGSRREQASLSLQFLRAHVAARFGRRAHHRAAPNIFRVLGLETKEDTISRLLYWLLNPQADHGLGSSLLLDFVAIVSRAAGRQMDRELLMKILGDSNIWSYQVLREYSRGGARVDLFVAGPPGRMVIETKLSALEHARQTRKYQRIFGESRPTVLVYLAAADAPSPTSRRFIHLPHDEVFSLLSDTLQRYNLNSTTESIIQQFLAALTHWDNNEPR